ncbi:unnamed protein product [Danaus chrysippus]|uniref:(African queen) hypothetical protein n=1 Tax=Danaus chrysippus TaxID=151541 RepID=A0A8J2VSL5_9NEOP|nr:unnamed protein product [Danaus chrysippus]
MKFRFLCCLYLLTNVYGAEKASGISQFWTEDFKVFDQVYGRTSDKDLYGEKLPPTVTYNVDITKPIHLTDKKEIYTKEKLNPLVYSDFNNPNILNYVYTKKKPALQFISLSNLKSISEANDPETYNYLKHLEEMTKKNRITQKNTLENDSDAEVDEAYRSIQEILDAHEANKQESADSDERPHKTQNDLKYLRGRNRNKVRQINGNSLKSRQPTRFRKSPSTVHVASRPYLRKIRYHYTS